MLVEKILARPFENLDAQSALRLMEDLTEVRWALLTVRSLTDEDETGQLTRRFEHWLERIDDRRAKIADIYLGPAIAFEGAAHRA